jgi:hypothetical protein
MNATATRRGLAPDGLADDDQVTHVRSDDSPQRTERRARSGRPDPRDVNAETGTRGLTQPGGPAPLLSNPSEPLVHTRMRALMLAAHYGLIGAFLGPVDAVDTDPKIWRWWYMPEGTTVADLKRGQNPYELSSDEVLPFCYALGLAAGIPEVFAYREGLPGWPGTTQ